MLILLLVSCAPRPRPVITQTAPVSQIRYFGEIKGIFGNELLSAPVALAFDPTNNLYLVDQGNNRIVKLNATLEFAREEGGFGLGLNGLSRPSGITSDGGINFFILDRGNNRVVRSDYNLVFADEIRFNNNPNLQALGKIAAIVYSRYGRMYLSDPDNMKVIALDKDYAIEAEILPPGGFAHCSALTIGDDGMLYVYDEDRKILYRFDSFGNSSGEIELPDAGVIADFLVYNGQVFATDKLRNELVIYDAAGSRIAAIGGLGSGPRNFNAPTGIALRSDNKLFVCDTGNDRIMIYEVAAK
jgi:hypothetical protein